MRIRNHCGILVGIPVFLGTVIACILALTFPARAFASSVVTAPTSLVAGNAVVSGLSIVSTVDGTDYTDAALGDTGGYDSSGTNSVCRTFDTVTYTLAYTTALKSGVTVAGYTEGDVYFKAVIPNATLAEVQFDTGSLTWAKSYSQYQDGSNVVLEGIRHVTNGDLPAAIPGTGTLSISVLVKAAADGSTYTPQFSVWLDGDSANARLVTAKTFTVSAKLSMNVKLAEASGGIAYGTQTFSNGASGATTGQGIVQNYTASIQVGSDQTSKGAEAPSSTKPITFKIDLTGTHTKVDKTTENATVGISYIKDAAGKATVTYVDNGDGTVTVTVSNYEVPELTASSAAPTTLINLTVGVFEGQPQVIPDDEKYEIAIEDTDLSATGVSGESLAAATPGTNDNQTVTTDDNVVTPYEYLTGTIAVTCTEYPGTMSSSTTYQALDLDDSISPFTSKFTGRGSGTETTGELLTIRTSVVDWTGMTTMQNALGAVDFLLKFDDKTLEVPDTESWHVDVTEAAEGGTDDATVVIRYAAKEDGTGWASLDEFNETGINDRASTNSTNLTFYDSLADLKADGKTCVGILMEIRGITAYGVKDDLTNNGPGIISYLQLRVKSDTSLISDKAVGFYGYDCRMYSSSLYIPSASEHAEDIANDPEKPAMYDVSIRYDGWDDTVWNTGYAASAWWSPRGYDSSGNKTTGVHDNLLAGSFYVTGMSTTTSYVIESQNSDGSPKLVYDLGAGENKVDYSVTPTVESPSDSTVSVKYMFSVPTGMTLDEGSLVLGGTYDPVTGTVSGGTKVAITSSDTYSTGITYCVEVDRLPLSQIKTLHYSTTIDSTATNNQEFTSFGYDYVRTPAKDTISSSNVYRTVSVIKVGEVRLAKTVETDAGTSATGTVASAKNGLTYHIVMRNTSPIDIEDMRVLDVLPNNGDALGTDITGSYKVKEVSLDLNGQTVSGDGIKLYYTTATDVQASGYNSDSVNLADGTWTEATNTGTDAAPTYVVDEGATAIVVAGVLPADGAEYQLNVALDTSGCLGELGNRATISSPNIPGDTLSSNGTETRVELQVNVTNTLTNIVTNNSAVTTAGGKDYTETLTAKDGYQLPETITVKVDGEELTQAVDSDNPQAGEYTYDSATGKVMIPGVSVTGDIEVIAAATPVYTLTNTLAHITTDQDITSTIVPGTDYKETLAPEVGYELPDSVTVTIGGTAHVIPTGTTQDGLSYDKATGKVTIDGDSVTGDVTVVAVATPIRCTVSFATDEGGTLAGGASQTVDYLGNATTGVTAKPETGKVFLGWEYEYTGLDGVVYSGTTANYTTVTIHGDVTFTAKYAGAGTVSATADHGYVKVAASTEVPTVGTDTSDTTALVKGESGYPASVGFSAQDNYHVSSIDVRDESGVVVGTLDPTLTTPQALTINGATHTFAVTTDADGKAGSIVTDDTGGGIVFDVKCVPDSHVLTNVLTGLVSSKTGTQTVTYGTDYTETLTPIYKAGETYKLPDVISVTVGNVSLTQAKDPANPQTGEFGYDSATGSETICGGEITGDVVITAQAKLGVENVLTNMVTNNTQTSISMGDSYTETLSPAEGYHNPATVKVTVSGVELTPAADSAADPQPGEYVYDQTTGVVTVPGSSVTGSLVITAEAVKTAKVVSTVTNGSNARGDSEVVDDGTAYDTTFSANDGYALPKTVDVTVGDTTYTIMSGDTSDTGITYDQTTGALHIPGSLVSGTVSINVACEQEQTPVTPENPSTPGTDGSGTSTETVTKVMATPNTGDTTSWPTMALIVGGGLLLAAAVTARRNARRDDH